MASHRHLAGVLEEEMKEVHKTMLAKERVYGSHHEVPCQGEVRAPENGVVFGLRSRPAVLEGEWCCFFGIIDEVRNDLIGS